MFHVGLSELGGILSSRANTKDVLIFDESDELIFAMPKKFLLAIGSNSCICFTATPGGDVDDNRVE